MFDFHLHSCLSFDSESKPADIVSAAEKSGLREICFTDHFDHNSDKNKAHNIFTTEAYENTFKGLVSSKIKVRHGVEFGLTSWNRNELLRLNSSLPLDFVIGSVHFVGGYDPYEKEYWSGRDTKEGFEVYLRGVLECVKLHDAFDVLGHINYACKSPNIPTKMQLLYKDFSDIVDEIMKILIENGKGIEVNTSGYDRVGEFLPSAEYLRRFRELGGEIVTVGSDAHTIERVGQYTHEAAKLVSDIFGYVCTFENRKPIFHKI